MGKVAKLIGMLALTGTVASGGALGVSVSHINKDEKFTESVMKKAGEIKKRRGEIVRNTYLQDSSRKRVFVRKGTKLEADDRVVVKGMPYYSVVTKYPGRGVILDGPKGLIPAGSVRLEDVRFDFEADLEGPQRTQAEKLCDSLIATFYTGLEARHKELRYRRAAYLLYMIYETGRQYEKGVENFVTEVLEGKAAGGLRDTLERLEKSEDWRFAPLLAQRLDSLGKRDVEEINTEYIILKYIRKAEPSMGVDILFRLLSRPNLSEDAKHTYVIQLGDTGGDRAIGYIMAHFDEGGMKYATPLMRAAKNSGDARRVYNFLQSKFRNWKGRCRTRAYEVPEFREFTRSLGLRVLEIPCPHQDSFCYVAPFGLPILKPILRCDYGDCACVH